MKCPQCGNENAPGTAFCGICGYSLGGYDSAASNQYQPANQYNQQFGNHYEQPDYMQQYGQKQYGAPEPKKKKLPVGAIIAIIIAALVVIGGISAVVVYTVSNNSSQSSSKDSDDSSESDSDSESSDEEDTTASDSSSSTTLDFGTISDDIYSNYSIGLDMMLPTDEWRFVSASEIVDTGDSITVDSATNKAVVEYGESWSMYYDMMMQNDTTGESVAVLISQSSDAWGLDMSSFLDTFCSGSEESLTSSGITCTYGDDTTAYIGSEIYTVRPMMCDYEGYSFVNYTAITEVDGEFVMIYLLSYDTTSTFEDIISNFVL